MQLDESLVPLVSQTASIRVHLIGFFAESSANLADIGFRCNTENIVIIDLDSMRFPNPRQRATGDSFS